MVTILARSNSKKKTGGSTGARKDWNVERFLIKVTVVGSAGPIRFVVKEGERVSDVIAIVLRSYAREGRRPILGSDHRDFLLYSSTYGSGGKKKKNSLGKFACRYSSFNSFVSSPASLESTIVARRKELRDLQKTEGGRVAGVRAWEGRSGFRQGQQQR